MPLCMILVLFAPAGIEILSLLAKERIFKDSGFVKGNSRKLFIIVIFLGIIIGLPKLFRPIGSGKQGYLTTAEWLKNNSEKEIFRIVTHSYTYFMISLGMVHTCAIFGLVSAITNGDKEIYIYHAVIAIIGSLLCKPKIDQLLDKLNYH